MIEKIKKYILDIIAERITREDMQKELNMTEKEVFEYSIEMMKSSLAKEDATLLEYAIYLTYIYEEHLKDYVYLLNRLLICGWHYSHEDIAWQLQQAKSPTSIKYLYDTVYAKYDYLDYDEAYALAVKCIWGLGDIRTEEAIERLKILTSSENEIIKKNALYQIERINNEL